MTNPNQPTYPDTFDSAVFYSCGEPERLYCTEPEQAIWDELDQMRPDTRDSIKVNAYRRMKVSLPGYLADAFAEQTEESYLESEHSDPEGDDIPISDEHRKHFVSLLQKAIDYFCEHVEGWACEVVAERTYSGEELEHIKNELYPDD